MPTIITKGAASAFALGHTSLVDPVANSLFYGVAGTYTFIAPTNVRNVSAVVVGGGGGGGANPGNYGGAGGALAYDNNIPVIPNGSYTVVVGANGVYTSGCGNAGNSYFIDNNTVAAEGGMGGNGYRRFNLGGKVIAGIGGQGGNSGFSTCAIVQVLHPGTPEYGPPYYTCCTVYYSGSGGGAGGYSGNGGAGGGNPGSGGGGGGGISGGNNKGSGGGVGLFGQSTSGPGGNTTNGYNGIAGSCGTGKKYGGGGYGESYFCNYPGIPGSSGAVRIIWPGRKRQFPNSCTGAP